MKSNISALKRNEEIFDVLLKTAAEEIMEEEMDALPNLDVLNEEYPPSEALDNRIRAIIKKEERTRKRPTNIRRFYRVAAGFGLLIILSAIILMSVEASRNYILNIFIDMQSDHIAFEFIHDGVNVEDMGLLLGYLPENFVLVNTQVMDTFAMAIFTNAGGDRIILQRQIADTLAAAVDNEIRDFSIINLNGQDAFLFEALEPYASNVLMWQHQNDVLALHSTLSADTLLQIAKHISLR